MNIRLYYFAYFLYFVIPIAILAVIGYPYYKNKWFNAEETAIPVVLAYNEQQNARSSAVYIGDGYFLTATHILDEDQYQLVMETNIGQKLVGDLLWSSDWHDISLFFSPDYDSVNIESYELNCSELSIGDELQFVGNPTNLDFVNTWGRVSAEKIEVLGMWKAALPVNGTILPGMSGGAVINEQNQLKGINVGTLKAVSGVTPLGPQRSFTGISYIVEASDICFLMGKT